MKFIEAFVFPVFLCIFAGKTRFMEYWHFNALSTRDLELQRANQYNILTFTVRYERLLIEQQGRTALDKIRNDALDKIIIINEILSKRDDKSSK